MIRTSTRTQRRGVILIVVLSLLTLFAIVGISFVLVADSHALASKIAREAETIFKPDIDPEQTFSMFMSQMMYDVNDDQTGIYSGLRSHSFARNAWGYNTDTGAQNVTAYSGIGRTRIPVATAGVTFTTPPPAASAANFLGYLVNHTYHSGDGFLIDPERITARTGPNPWTAPKGNYVSGAVPYTYADHNNFFLATIDPATGRVVVPSFHRPWLFGQLNGGVAGNPNWGAAAPHGKYLTPRPRPAEMGAGFPFCEDAGGDVKNRIGAPGGNDSIWIDIGAPVMQSADGRKYKPLFAPLIVDLDGCVNLNAHGNVRGNGNLHASNQGWGPWEVNLNRVLSANATEVQTLLLGMNMDRTVPVPGPPTPQPRVLGRYGLDLKPNNVGGSSSGPNNPQVWAPIDSDGVDAAYNYTTRFKLPGEDATVVGHQTYPSYLGTGYPRTAADVGAENLEHPRRYNSLRPSNGDRIFPASSLAALMRRGQTGANGLSSELHLLLPTNLVRDPALSVNDPINIARDKRSRLVTTHSYDLDRPAGLPYIWTPDLAWDATTNQPTRPAGSSMPFSAIGTNRALTPPTGSDFDATTWRSTASALLRLDLNRTLGAYPAPVAATGQIDLTVAANMTAYTTAVSDRTKMAQAIYDRLVLLTGAPAPVAAATDPTFRTRRWLAQLAINIVDYIDEDDTMSVWPWSTTPADTVYGTEQPSLLLNEVHAQFDNVGNDTGVVGVMPVANRRATDGTNINVWAELHNPRVTQTGPLARDNIARLATNNQAVYQVVLASYPGTNDGRSAMAEPENATGNAGTTAVPTNATSTVDWVGAPAGTLLTVLPNNNQFAEPNPPMPATARNNGFYVVGPTDSFLPADANVTARPGNPNLTATFQHNGMRLFVPQAMNPANYYPTVYLRRLANPHLAHDPVANPYLTVDAYHLGNLAQLNDARTYDAAGGNSPTYVPVDNRRSTGRRQPLGALEVQNQNPNPVLVGQAQNTFFQHNFEKPTAPVFNVDASTTMKIPFDWMVHLDRPLVSPLELLHVSAWKPHQLTEKFVSQTPVLPATMPPSFTYAAHAHRAAWYTGEARLHRLLEFVTTHPLADGVAAGGRVPGRININTILDESVLQALCDAQGANKFAASHVAALYTQYLNQRDGLSPTGTRYFPGEVAPDPVLNTTVSQKPYWGLSMGVSASADEWTGGIRGLEQSILAPVAGGGPLSARMFDPQVAPTAPLTAQHPYHQTELMNKIFSNLTTRSNVYAVWVTVGYFEVTDETARPVKLGAEIGRAEGRHVRHRMFAIIDRTKMEAHSGTATVATVGPNQTLTLPGWTQEGTWITLDPNTATEQTVMVKGGVLVSEKAVTDGPHPAVIYGNPGPRPRYNPKNDGCVLYYSLID